MKTEKLESLFHLPPSSVQKNLVFGSSHFFNRAKTYVHWNSFNIICDNRTLRFGKVILGQIPIRNFETALFKELRPGALVVSCNDCFELAGIGTPFQVKPAYRYHDHNFEHYHLPFQDFSDNVNPFLLIQTLEKMYDVYNNGNDVYIHCKAGRSRSALVAALFLLRINDNFSSDLSNAANDDDLKIIFLQAVKTIKAKRPQISIGPKKIALAVQVLNEYKQYYNNSNPLMHAQPNKRTIILNSFAQSDLYKFLWSHAYKNPHDFEIIKKVSADYYDFVKQATSDEDLTFACYVNHHLNNPKEKKIIEQICHLHHVSNAFRKKLKCYEDDDVQDIGCHFHDQLIDCELDIDQKIELFSDITLIMGNQSTEKETELHTASVKDHKSTRDNSFMVLMFGLVIISLSTILLSIYVASFAMILIIPLTIGLTVSVLHYNETENQRPHKPYAAAEKLLESIRSKPVFDFSEEEDSEDPELSSESSQYNSY